jgi:hypothetical protein
LRSNDIPKTITVVHSHQENGELPPPPVSDRCYKRLYKVAAHNAINSAYVADREGRFMDAINDCEIAIHCAKKAANFGSKREADTLERIAEMKLGYLLYNPPSFRDMRSNQANSQR